MTLEEAIKVLISGSELSKPWLLTGYEDALKLGIEASKYIVRSRVFGAYPVCEKLPGETED